MLMDRRREAVMKYKTSKGAIFLAKAASVVMWNQFRYPQPVKGR